MLITRPLTLAVLLASLGMLAGGCDNQSASSQAGAGVTAVSHAEGKARCEESTGDCSGKCSDCQTGTTAAATPPPPMSCCPAPTAEAAPKVAAATDDSTAVLLGAAPAVVEAVNVLKSAGEAESDQPAARASPWLTPDQRQAFGLDFQVTDQDGNSHRLASLIDRPTAVSFIYTRCSDPNMCPAITVQMANLQHELKQAGLGSRTQLLLISYDPVFDEPARLKRWGDDRGIRFGQDDARILLLRPDPAKFRELLMEFQLDLAPQADGSFLHRIELVLMDHQRRFVRDYLGHLWQNAAVLEDLKKLVEEASAGKA